MRGVRLETDVYGGAEEVRDQGNREWSKRLEKRESGYEMSKKDQGSGGEEKRVGRK